MTTKKKNGHGDGTTRYSRTEKEEILSFIDEFDREHGRGGIQAARRKYGVSPPTIKVWRTTTPSRSVTAEGDWQELARERLSTIEEEAKRIRRALGI